MTLGFTSKKMMGATNESTALLQQAQMVMESSVARLKERLRLFAADSLAKGEVTMRWWARQSEALQTRLELRWIRWRAVRAVRRMKRTHALTPIDAADLERGLALLLDESLAEIERHMAPGQCQAEGIQARQGHATWLYS